jgi:hypothetical protein
LAGPLPIPIALSLKELYAQRERIRQMTNPLSPESIEWGCQLDQLVLPPGRPYWRINEVSGPMDIGGNHHIYVDVWDENGNRIVGVPVAFYSLHETWTYDTEPKRGEPYAVNLPMYAGGKAYGVRIAGGLPSESVSGLGLGSFTKHHSFRVIFQRAISVDSSPKQGTETTLLPSGDPLSGDESPPIQVDANPPLTLLEELEAAKFYLDRAIALERKRRS